LLVGPDFKETFSKSLISNKLIEDSPKETDGYVESIKRFSIICKIDEAEEKNINGQLPFLAIIPEKTIEIKTENSTYTHSHPISVCVCNKTTNSCNEGFVLVYLRLKEDRNFTKEMREG